MYNRSGILIYIFFLLSMGFISVNGQRVPPGVPPQHYQQPPPQYQQHPQQPQFQQQAQQNVPPEINQQHYQQPHQVNYQQVPVQQQPPVQPVPVPVQQVPGSTNGGHHAAHNHDQQQVLNANIKNEREHIQEHMQVPIDTQKMSDTELQFHYFKMHDSDNNNKLDGCELIKSLVHWHEGSENNQANNGEHPRAEGKIFVDDELVYLIDPILQMDDTSKDGYIDYPEFMRAQQKARQSQP